jgi:membrane protease YdiL (CAAX protease family)
MFIIAPILFAKFWMKLNFKTLVQTQVNPKLILLSIVLVIIIVPFNNFLLEWNSNIQLPLFLSDVETQIKLWEAKTTELTKVFLDFKSFPMLLLVIFVIGLIPAVGEELLFRGLIQTTVLRKAKNPYLGILLVAILFSAIHFQFYGFFPRLMLGLLLGLVYYWSGNLIYSIVFHFFNNSLTVLFFYLYNIGVIEANIMDDHTLPYLTVIFSFMVTLVSLLYFRRLSIKEIKH